MSAAFQEEGSGMSDEPAPKHRRLKVTRARQINGQDNQTLFVNPPDDKTHVIQSRTGKSLSHSGNEGAYQSIFAASLQEIQIKT